MKTKPLNILSKNLMVMVMANMLLKLVQIISLIVVVQI